MVLRRGRMSTSAPPGFAEPSPAFDAESAGYRVNWDSRPIVRNWRGRVLAAVMEGANAGMRVVDIGAGAGADTSALRASGCVVIAVEPSEGMRAAAATRGVLPLAGSLSSAPAQVGGGHDVVLLNFGVLNCISSLGGLREALAGMLAVGGRAVLVWMSPRCPVDTLARLVRGQRPRRGRPVAIVAGHPVPVSWWTVSEVTRALMPDFVVRRVEAVGLLVPSPDLGGEPGLRSAVEPWFARLPTLREWGDHTLLVAERTA